MPKFDASQQREKLWKIERELSGIFEIVSKELAPGTLHIMVNDVPKRRADYWPVKGTLQLNGVYTRFVDVDDAIAAILTGTLPAQSQELRDAIEGATVNNKPKASLSPRQLDPISPTVDEFGDPGRNGYSFFRKPVHGWPDRHPLPAWAVVGPQSEIPPWENLPSETSISPDNCVQ